jgi:hypothetical protein
VIVRGSNVMRGYLGRPAETARALRGGWLRTGAVGRLDQDGYLIVVPDARATTAVPVSSAIPVSSAVPVSSAIRVSSAIPVSSAVALS